MYSKDFKLAVVQDCKEGGTQIAVAKKFKVGAKTVWLWLKEYEQTGTVSGSFDLSKRQPHKIDNEKLKAFIKENPGVLLKEIAAVFGCTVEGARLAMKRNALTRKKN
jgi:transposase